MKKNIFLFILIIFGIAQTNCFNNTFPLSTTSTTNATTPVSFIRILDTSSTFLFTIFSTTQNNQITPYDTIGLQTLNYYNNNNDTTNKVRQALIKITTSYNVIHFNDITNNIFKKYYSNKYQKEINSFPPDYPQEYKNESINRMIQDSTDKKKYLSSRLLVSSRFPLPQGTYQLDMIINGSIYKATCSSTPPPQFQNVVITKQNSIDYRIESSFQCETEGYYLFKVYRYPDRKKSLGKEVTNSVPIMLSTQNTLSAYIGKNYTYMLPAAYQFQSGDSVVVRMISINPIEGKIISSYKQTYLTSPFETPPTFYRSNIQNLTDPSKPPIGYFSINNYADKSIIIK